MCFTARPIICNSVVYFGYRSARRASCRAGLIIKDGTINAVVCDGRHSWADEKQTLVFYEDRFLQAVSLVCFKAKAD